MDTKFQQKHESDMTKKEKRQLERQKLKSMGVKQKLEYVLTYYRVHLAIVIVAILAVIGIVKWVDNLKSTDMLYAAAVNGDMNGGSIMEEFRREIKDTDKYHRYTMDTSVYAKDGNDYTTSVKLATLVGSGQLDLMICPEEMYRQYANQEDTLLNIRDLMGEDFTKAYPELCMEDAIRVEQSQVLQKYGLVGTEPSYLIVFYYTGHQETAKQFIEFIMK